MSKPISIVFLILLCIAPVLAQEDDACPAIVQTAVETAGDACAMTGRNQACYGNHMAEADARDAGAALAFERPGDTVSLVDLRALHLSPLDTADSVWGIAVMRVQANIPDTLPGQNVTFVLFGDAEIEDASGEPLPTLPASANSTANLRAGPSTANAVVGSLARGESITLDGRLADSSWLRLQRTEGAAWVFANLVTPDGDLDSLEIVDPSASGPSGPMQAFYFRSGVGDAPCAAAPESGLLIQTPHGVGEISLGLDGLQVGLASTAFVNGGGSALNVFLLEGNAYFPQSDVSLHPGQWQPFVQQNGVYIPDGDPQNFDPRRFDYLPLSLLPRRVDIPQRAVANSIVYDEFTPSLIGTPNGRAALLLHGANLDKVSWDWLIGPLRDAGWVVVTPDMPGHGETARFGTDPRWTDWQSIARAFVDRLRSEQGIASGIIVGSSIGANAAVNACAALPDWCLGVILLSPGTNYYNVETRAAMGSMGNRPVFIAAARSDNLGGPASVARQVAGAGENVTLQVYDGGGHGTDLAGAFPLAADIFAWLNSSLSN